MTQNPPDPDHQEVTDGLHMDVVQEALLPEPATDPEPDDEEGRGQDDAGL
jgi:hypothetical protein